MSLIFSNVTPLKPPRCSLESQRLNVPVRIVNSWKSRENVIPRRRIPSIIRPLKSKPTWKTPSRRNDAIFEDDPSPPLLSANEKLLAFRSVRICFHVRETNFPQASPPLLFFFWNAPTERRGSWGGGGGKEGNQRSTLKRESEMEEKQIYWKRGKHISFNSHE